MTTVPAVIGFKQARVAGGNNEVTEQPPTSSPPKMAFSLKALTGTPSDESSPRVPGRKRAGLRQSITAMINVRRLSKAFGLLKNTSSVASTQPRPVMLENTYRMKPDDGRRFSTQTVKRVVEAVLAKKLKDVKYNPVRCKDLVGELTLLIRDRVKALGFPRYKIICHVLIGEKKDQGFEVASRCLWSTDTDDWACVDYANDSLFAVATVHATYFE